jgi:predicted dinucleotide-binding enzyme
MKTENQQSRSSGHGKSARPRLGILGAGNFGGRLATLARTAGYEVLVGKRENALSVAVQSEIFVIAIPFMACTNAFPPLAAALEGKVVVDPTNPLNADWSPVSFGDQSSAGEEVAKLLPGARVVKAFNTVFAHDIAIFAPLCVGKIYVAMGSQLPAINASS